MKRESLTVGSLSKTTPRSRSTASPFVDLLVDTRRELFELTIPLGLKVLEDDVGEDRAAICGPRYPHRADRPASRAGTVPSEVVFGGRKVAIRRPRVRANGREVALPIFQTLAAADPLNRRIVERDAGRCRHAPVRPELGSAACGGQEPRD